MDDQAGSPLAETLRQDFRALEQASAMVRNRNGTIHFWGRGMERLYGYPSREAIGRSSHQLLRTEFPSSMEGSPSPFLNSWSCESSKRSSPRGSRYRVSDRRRSSQPSR